MMPEYVTIKVKIRRKTWEIIQRSTAELQGRARARDGGRRVRFAGACGDAVGAGRGFAGSAAKAALEHAIGAMQHVLLAARA